MKNLDMDLFNDPQIETNEDQRFAGIRPPTFSLTLTLVPYWDGDNDKD